MSGKLQRFIISFLILIMAIIFMKLGYADDVSSNPTANIRLAISGAGKTNRFYLCMPGVGCLSLTAGAKGQVFKMMSPIEINRLFLSDIEKRNLSFANPPKSCANTVDLNQTVTFKGRLITDGKNRLTIEGLTCSITKN